MTAYPRKGVAKSAPKSTVASAPAVAGATAVSVNENRKQDTLPGPSKRKRSLSRSSNRSVTYDPLNVDSGAQTDASKRSKMTATSSDDPNIHVLRNGRIVEKKGKINVSSDDTGANANGLASATGDEEVEDEIDDIIRAFDDSSNTNKAVSVYSDKAVQTKSVTVEPSRTPSADYDVTRDPLIPNNFVDAGMASREYYKGLVALSPPFRPIKSVFFREEERVLWMSYPNVAARLPAEAAGWVISLARAPLEDTEVAENRLRDVQSKNQSLCVTIGVVSSCQIVEGSANMTSTSSQQVHHITIRPFGFEFRREQTYMGLKFGYDEITGPLYLHGFRIRTAAQVQPFAPAFARSTPDENRTRYVGVLAPIGDVLPVYTGPVPFEVPVEIYDGRHDSERPFMFTGDDFEKLRSWPRLVDVDGGLADVTKDSIVAVGYTLRKTGTGVPVIMPELQFVIALHAHDSE